MSYTTKKYNRINWKNRPSTATALGATNLNHMDVFLNEVDDALVTMDAEKLNVSVGNSMLKSVEYDKKTGVWTFRQLDGTTQTFDQNIEKIPVSFSLSEAGILTMTTDDGTKWECNIAELIKAYSFDDTDTIAFNKSFSNDEYHVTASIKAGSINENHLNPDYRADILNYRNTAQTAANDALTYSKDAKRWAIGDASYEGSGTDNAKYYKEQAEIAKTAAEKAYNDILASGGATVATIAKNGISRPDGTSITITPDGTLSAVIYISDGGNIEEQEE